MPGGCGPPDGPASRRARSWASTGALSCTRQASHRAATRRQRVASPPAGQIPGRRYAMPVMSFLRCRRGEQRPGGAVPRRSTPNWGATWRRNHCEASSAAATAASISPWASRNSARVSRLVATSTSLALLLGIAFEPARARCWRRRRGRRWRGRGMSRAIPWPDEPRPRRAAKPVSASARCSRAAGRSPRSMARNPRCGCRSDDDSTAESLIRANDLPQLTLGFFIAGEFGEHRTKIDPRLCFTQLVVSRELSHNTSASVVAASARLPFQYSVTPRWLSSRSVQVPSHPVRRRGTSRSPCRARRVGPSRTQDSIELRHPAHGRLPNRRARPPHPAAPAPSRSPVAASSPFGAEQHAHPA